MSSVQGLEERLLDLLGLLANDLILIHLIVATGSKQGVRAKEIYKGVKGLMAEQEPPDKEVNNQLSLEIRLLSV